MIFHKDIIRWKKLSRVAIVLMLPLFLFFLLSGTNVYAQVPSEVCLGACPSTQPSSTIAPTNNEQTPTSIEPSTQSPTTDQQDPCVTPPDDGNEVTPTPPDDGNEVTPPDDGNEITPTPPAEQPNGNDRGRRWRHPGRNGGIMELLLQLLEFILNKIIELLGGIPNTVNFQAADPCAPTTAPTTEPLTGTPTVPPTDTGFPYPRGTAPAYGYMACDLDACKAKGATLIHPGWRDSYPVQQFVDVVNQAKSLGVEKYLVSSMAPDGNSDAYWKSLKDAGITDNDFFGVYFPDEPSSPTDISTMYQSMKKYFPKALAGDYGVENAGTEFAPYLDIAFFTTYTKFHDRAHAFPYSNLITNGPAWKSAGKIIWETTETFGDACVVTAGDPDLSTEKLVIDRQISQIVMGILGGAQGVFPYAEAYSTGTPCDTAWTNFKPRYVEVWPWIMKGERKLLTTQVTSGTTSIDSEGTTVPAVVAYLFTDASGKQLIGSSSMLDVTEANNTANAATITGVPNGTYDVLWENRTVAVTDGSIKDTWQPYAYHFYKLK